jgi:secretion/DNA translocation related TadE-like protein
VLWAAVVVVATATTAAVWGGVVAARHRAGQVADLAALAAAGAALGRDGCADAARVAAESGARLVSCGLLADGSTLVEVTVPGPGAVPGLGPARARSRAGAEPATERPP